MLKKAKTPEHRKLLKYTLERLRKAALSIDLRPNGTFTWIFNDGYEPDFEEAGGTWKSRGQRVILSFPNIRYELPLSVQGTKLLVQFHHIDGLTATFSR